jgi:uncharacterized protein
VIRLDPARWYGQSKGMKHKLLAWPLALAIVVLLHVVSAFALLQLNFNNAPEAYFPSDSPAIVLRNELRAEFPGDEVLTVLFKAENPYSADFLARLNSLARELGTHPLVDRVLAVTTVEKISATEDGFAVELLVDPEGLEDSTPEMLRQRVLDDRFAPEALASIDGQYLALAVRPIPLSESRQRKEIRQAVIRAVELAGLTDQLVADAGPVTLDVAQLESILNDSLLFIPLTTIIGLSLLAWVVGKLRPVVIGAVAMSTVVLPMVAGIAAFGQPYTMATAILPSLLAAYTLATLIHLYAGIQRARVALLPRPARIDRALSETLRPGLFNVLTTGAGLLSLTLVPIPPIQVFGIAGAFGTLLVFLTVFFLAPPFLLHWDVRRWPRRGSGMGHTGRLAGRLVRFSLRHPKGVVFGALLLVAAAFPFAQRVQVESDLLKFFGPDHSVTRSTELIESKLSGVTTLEISIRGSRRDDLASVEPLQAMREFQVWMESLPEVDRTISMADLVEEMHWAMNEENPEFRSLPPTDQLLRQYLLIYDGKDLYELVNREYDHARIVVNLNVHGTQEIARVIATLRTHLAEEPLGDLEVDIGGFGRLFTDQEDLLVDGQINSFMGAFIQIFLFMAILWRSLGAAALGIIPNLAPLYFIFVLMGMAGIYLDMATVMIASVVLGITVDDTIHLYYGYRARLKKGMSPVFAIARSFQSSGRAVLAISVLLIAQFGLLANSAFIPTANFGLMTAVGLLAGQMFELLLLPALLLIKDGRKGRTTQS